MKENTYITQPIILEQLKQQKHFIFLTRENECGGYFLNRLDRTKNTLCPKYHSIEDTFLFEPFFSKQMLEYLNKNRHIKGHYFINNGQAILTLLKIVNNEWKDFSLTELIEQPEVDQDVKRYTIKRK